jgi:hypothetical protein
MVRSHCLGKLDFIAHVKCIASECTSSHCVIQHQTLTVKKIPKILEMVLDEVVKFVNFIKSRPEYNSLLCAL